VRAYDARTAIELRYDPRLFGNPAGARAQEQSWQPIPPPALAASLPEPEWTPEPEPPRALSTREPEPTAPRPRVAPAAEPQFTSREDDESVAAAFDDDLAAIRAAAPGPEGVAADADAFLQRALTEAPAPERRAPGEPEPPAPSEEDDAVPRPGVGYGHEIFDAMAASANQFDLGSVTLDLASTFDAFDAAADRSAQSKATAALESFQPDPSLRDLQAVEDLAQIKQEVEAQEARELDDLRRPVAPKPDLIGQVSRDVAVTYDVPLVPQQTGYSCWAAAAAMIVAWRDNLTVDPAALASGTGPWHRYKDALQLEDPTMFDTWGLAAEERPTVYTVASFRRLLETWGPLFVGGADPGPHVRVVVGLTGDGTPTGTTVHIADPWERGLREFRLPNAGATYTETYAEFEANQAELTRGPERRPGIYVAHADRERSRR
jgi:hypothetical protein